MSLTVCAHSDRSVLFPRRNNPKFKIKLLHSSWENFSTDNVWWIKHGGLQNNCLITCSVYMDTNVVPSQIREQILSHSSNAGTNPMLDKHQLEDAAVTPPSECCRCCTCLCHMALLVEMCSYSDTTVHQLCPLGKCSHRLCRVLGTCTWFEVDHWVPCHSSMVWWHVNPTHGWSHLIRPGITVY